MEFDLNRVVVEWPDVPVPRESKFLALVGRYIMPVTLPAVWLGFSGVEITRRVVGYFALESFDVLPGTPQRGESSLRPAKQLIREVIGIPRASAKY